MRRNKQNSNSPIKLTAIITCVFMLTVSGFGCVQTDNTTSGEDKLASLQIGVMPAVDSAPIFLAESKGYFEDAGLDVEIQIYTNAMNRQSALQSGELDGAMTDVIALVNNVENGFNIRVTTSTDGVFPFLMKTEIDDKSELKAGMMEVSVTNFLSDRLLADQYTLEKVYINEIPARLEMVAKGELDLAVVPEPMASQGALNGLVKKLYANTDEYSPDLIVFTGDAISGKSASIQVFHDVYSRAALEINEDDAEAREILVSRLELKSEIIDDIIMPEYHPARLPDEAYFSEVMTWNESVLGNDLSIEYEDLVDDSFTSK